MNKTQLKEKSATSISIQEHWQIVSNFKNAGSAVALDLDKVLDLEFAMLSILEQLNVETHNMNAGFSRRVPRYSLRTSFESSDQPTKERLEKLQQQWWIREMQQQALKELIKKEEQAVQQTCQHYWVSDSDGYGRSRYSCEFCNQLR